jgi:hypothetical protein
MANTDDKNDPIRTPQASKDNTVTNDLVNQILKDESQLQRMEGGELGDRYSEASLSADTPDQLRGIEKDLEYKLAMERQVGLAEAQKELEHSLNGNEKETNHAGHKDDKVHEHVDKGMIENVSKKVEGNLSPPETPHLSQNRGAERSK